MLESLSMAHWFGKRVIVCVTDNYWLGTLVQKAGQEVLLADAACIKSGISNISDIVEPHLSGLKRIWLHASEIIPYEGSDAPEAACACISKCG